MNLRTRIALVTLITSACVACASTGVPAPETPAAASPAAQPAASTAGGRAAFLNACSGCHGEDATGGLGPPLVPARRDAETLNEIVRNGLGLMPPLDPGLITDDQIVQVVAFLNSLSQ